MTKLPVAARCGLFALVMAVCLAACDEADSGAATDSGAVRGEIIVFAAASLTDAFTEIGSAFEAAHPDTDVVFNFGGTPTLRAQLEQGARADVFASADPRQMELARASGLIEGEAQVFARNSLVVILPASNPGAIKALSDLGHGDLKLLLANAEVPAGAYARAALAAMAGDAAFGAGFRDAVLRNLVSLESNVKQVVAKVELGEADAGIVYHSDVTSSVAPQLALIEIPSRFNVEAEYPVGIVQDGRNGRGGRAFIDYVLSPTGQAVLARHGFA